VRTSVEVVVALIVGIITGTVWARWRHDVVKELRTIRDILERWRR